MHDKILRVWLDAYGSYEQVGSIENLESEPVFRYSGSYAGNPVSASLPLQAGPFPAENAAAFFAGLAPEGGMREYFQKILRAEEDEYAKLLERLNDESAGALVFSVGGDTSRPVVSSVTVASITITAAPPRDTILFLPGLSESSSSFNPAVDVTSPTLNGTSNSALLAGTSSTRTSSLRNSSSHSQFCVIFLSVYYLIYYIKAHPNCHLKCDETAEI